MADARANAEGRVSLKTTLFNDAMQVGHGWTILLQHELALDDALAEHVAESQLIE